MLDAGLSVKAFFTDREGGVGVAPYDTLNVSDAVGDDAKTVAANRKVLAKLAGAPVTFMKPVHGAGFARIDSSGATAPEADILITTTPGVALAALAADCVPVILHDAMTGAVGVAHIGRSGLFEGAVDNALSALADIRGSWGDLLSVTAVIGPAICGRCYEVPAAMRADISSRHPAAFGTTKWGTPSLDLPRAVEARFGELGTNVVRHSRCTFEDPNLFSRRMDGVTGRQAAVVVCG